MYLDMATFPLFCNAISSTRGVALHPRIYSARCAASLVDVNLKTAAYYYRRLREIIACHLEEESNEVWSGEIEVDESYRSNYAI